MILAFIFGVFVGLCTAFLILLAIACLPES